MAGRGSQGFVSKPVGATLLLSTNSGPRGQCLLLGNLSWLLWGNGRTWKTGPPARKQTLSSLEAHRALGARLRSTQAAGSNRE